MSVISWHMYMYDVGMDGMKLRDVPYNERKKIICYAGIENNGMALEFVPEKYKSLGLCKKALEGNANAVKYVPIEILNELVKNEPDLVKSLSK